MLKHGGAPSRSSMSLMLVATSPPSDSQGQFAWGHQSGLAGCKLPPLSKRRAFYFTVTGAMLGGNMGRLSMTECTYLRTYLPTYLPTDLHRLLLRVLFGIPLLNQSGAKRC